MTDVTPVQLANFDQALADTEHNLDVLIDLFRNGDPESPEHIRISGFCCWLAEMSDFDRVALGELLAVAVRRLERRDPLPFNVIDLREVPEHDRPA